MALQDKKGISLATGFDLQAKLPLDSRLVVENTAGLQWILDNNAFYEGMTVYNREERKIVTLKPKASVEAPSIDNAADWEWVEVAVGKGPDLTPYVKSAEELGADFIVLGSGEKNVKASTVKVQIDTLGTDNTTLPTSLAVKASIDGAKSELSNKITEVEGKVTANTNKFGEYYNKTEIDKKIGDALTGAFQVVEDLPEKGQEGVIYLVLVKNKENVYTKYIWEGDQETGKFINLGTTEIDLSGYYTKDQVDGKFATKEELTQKESTLSGRIDTKLDTQAFETFKGGEFKTAQDEIAALKKVGAQANVLEGVKVNNVDLPIEGKKVNIDLQPYAKTETVEGQLALKADKSTTDGLRSDLDALTGEVAFSKTIKSVDTSLELSPEGALGVKGITIDKVDTLQAELNKKVNSSDTQYQGLLKDKHTHTNKETLDAITAAYTTEEKTKLEGIAAGAQVNVIEEIKVAGVKVEPKGKSVDIVGLATEAKLTTELAKKLDSETFNTEKATLEGKINEVKTAVGNAESGLVKDVTELKASVATKAEKSAVDTLTSRVGANETSITALQEADKLLATKEELTAVSNKANKNETAITALSGTVGNASAGLVKDVADLKTKVAAGIYYETIE